MSSLGRIAFLGDVSQVTDTVVRHLIDLGYASPDSHRSGPAYLVFPGDGVDIDRLVEQLEDAVRLATPPSSTNQR